WGTVRTMRTMQTSEGRKSMITHERKVMNSRNTARTDLNKKKRIARSLGLLLAALVLATTATAATTVTVQVAPGGDLSFSPSSVSIQPGDTVRWVWASAGMAHSVTSGTNCA